MIKKILDWLPWNGYKTVIGAALIIVAAIVSGLSGLIDLFPDVVWLQNAGMWASDILEWVKYLAELVGYSLASVGLAHKAVK